MASPKLRFKEFSLDWELKSLGSITKWYSGGTPSKDIEDYWGNGYPLISGASMHTDLLEESNVHITALGLQNGSKLAPKNSILLLVRGSMLFNRIPVGIAQKDLAFNQDVKCLIPSNGVLYQFIFQWFKSKESFIKNKVTSTGIGAGKLDTDDLQNLSFFQPTEKEQTKIASFLTTIDKKISQLNEQHQLMIQYKKGVMQKIFSQEIRFKDDNGEEFGEWEEKKLGKLCCITTGKLDANAMVENGKYRFYTCAKEFYHIDNFAFDSEALLISGNGANVGYIHYYNGKFNAYQRTYVLEKWTENIIYVKFFLEHFLKGRINIGKNEGNTPYIVLSVLTEMPILLPCLNEQAKIADFITKLECKIENLSSQLKLAKEWKKGLLQQMFV